MDLSIIIPARNEMFLARTIEDILTNMRGDTEVIAVLDGEWAAPPIPDHERVTLVYNAESVGQRAATNQAARMSTAKYLAKCDAHCAFDEGFDTKLIADMQDDWTVVPVMRNLHAFDWVCECGHRTYQGPQKCGGCGREDVVMEVVWRAKPSPNSTAYRFDNTMHFQYWGEYKARQLGDIAETMSLQGSFWMATRDKYFELDLCDEAFGSWGQQGVEVACKTWLSGGRVMVNKKTWYAHMFRTQHGFSFPYPISGRQVAHAREYSRKLFMENNWEKAVRPFSWIIEHFSPVPDWETPGGLSKGVVYYTDNRLDKQIMDACQRQLRSATDMRIVSVSLEQMDFGDNIHLPLERSYLTMFKQILAGLEELDTDIVFFCEHDVLYHPSHFEFTPARNDVVYYNENVWKVRLEDGHCLRHWVNQTSGLVAYRSLLLDHYRKRVAATEEAQRTLDEGQYKRFIRRQGFEPGTHNRKERVDDYKCATYRSEYPNVDIRHSGNLTPSRWRKEQFRNQRYTEGWMEADSVPGWGDIRDAIYNISRED